MSKIAALAAAGHTACFTTHDMRSQSFVGASSPPLDGLAVILPSARRSGGLPTFIAHGPRAASMGAAFVLSACAGASAPASSLTVSAANAQVQGPSQASRQALSETRPNPVGRMARVSEATYQMGTNQGEPDEGPPHDVHVAAFDMDLTEVTVAQYSECVREGRCMAAPIVVQFPGVTATDQQLYDPECNDNRSDRQDHPVNCVDWKMADTYCRWAGKRLPTEEEWEYAACAGSCDKALAGLGGVGAILTSARWPYTTRVAMTRPGAFGLYDMAGNVWEWTASRYCLYDHPGCDEARRVIRGGSWSLADFWVVRLTDRSPADPSNRLTNVGFRCARSASAP